MVDPTPDTVADYKSYLVRMIRERAAHWERTAGIRSDDVAYRATCMAYRGAYNDVATLIEFGEVAW